MKAISDTEAKGIVGGPRQGSLNHASWRKESSPILPAAEAPIFRRETAELVR